MTADDLDLSLVRKYNQPAPRYTSYPPANHFTDDVASFAPESLIADDNAPSAPGAHPSALSLYFHLPFCAARCWFCGCTNIITSHRESAADYIDDLAQEIALVAPRIDTGRRVTQLHLGGGTPTFFPAEQLHRFAELVHRHFRFTADAEISVEIDPRHLDAPQILALRVLGARRASIGVQDTDPAVQAAIHRVQPMEINRRAVTKLREAGFTSVNIDLIYGLPLQTPATFDRTIDDVLSLRPDRLSIFSYAHVPSLKPAQRIFEQRGELPSAEQKLALFALAHRRLLAAGYQDIGLDHYALPDDELAVAARQTAGLQRNFQGYSTRAGASLYGFGISAISSSNNGHWQNTKDLFAYRAALAEGRLPIERGHRLTPEDHRRRTLIMTLMCDRRLDYAALGEELGCDIPSTYARELASLADLEADGVVEFTASGLRVTPAGTPLLRIIASRFDAYIRQSTAKHAQAV